MNIRYLRPFEDCNSESDNLEVHMRRRAYSSGRWERLRPARGDAQQYFLCMDNAGVDSSFGTPPLFVKLLNRDCMEGAIQALVAEDGGCWLEVYGTLQTVCYGRVEDPASDRLPFA